MASFRYDKATIIELAEKAKAKWQEELVVAEEKYIEQLQVAADVFKRQVGDWYLGFDARAFAADSNRKGPPRFDFYYNARTQNIQYYIGAVDSFLDRVRLVKADSKDAVRISDKDQIWTLIASTLRETQE